MTIEKVYYNQTYILVVKDDDGEPVTLTAHRDEYQADWTIGAIKAIVEYCGKATPTVITNTKK